MAAKAHVTAGQVVWVVRWLLSASLLVGALIILSAPVPAKSIWWLRLGSNPTSPSFPLPTRLLLVGFISATLAAAIFFTRRTFRDELRSAFSDARADLAWPLWLCLYALTVAGLYKLLNASSADQVLTPSHILCIAILTVSAVATWCLGVMPARLWVHWLRGNRPGVFLGAVTIGAFAYVLGRHYTPIAVANLWVIAGPLQRWTLFLSASLLRLLAHDVVFDPKEALIGTPDFAVYIDAGCAGWEGVALFLVFFCSYLIVYRRELRFPYVLLLLPIGASLIWCFNIVRIVALILIGNFSDALGVYGFHSVAGWLFFNAATIGLVATSQRLKFFSKEIDAGSRSISTSNPALPYLVPLLAIVGTGMVTRAFSPVLSYPLQVVAGGAALWSSGEKTLFRLNLSWSAILLGFLVFVMWIAATPTKSAFPDVGAAMVSASAFSGKAGALWIMLRIVGAVVVAPIAEELAFRGYLIRKLVDSHFETVPFQRFTWFSFLGSSLIFGILHDQWLAGCLAGMVFAAALHRRGYLSDAILSHAVANGLLAAYVLPVR